MNWIATVQSLIAETTGGPKDPAGLHSWLVRGPASGTPVGRRGRTPGWGSRSQRASAR